MKAPTATIVMRISSSTHEVSERSEKSEIAPPMKNQDPRNDVISISTGLYKMKLTIKTMLATTRENTSLPRENSGASMRKKP